MEGFQKEKTPRKSATLIFEVGKSGKDLLNWRLLKAQAEALFRVRRARGRGGGISA